MASESIRKFVGYLNNESKDGGYWLPNIQRQFVWKEGQIEKLYDSILREYPIGSLLIWRTKDPIKLRSFIKNYKSDLRITDFYQAPSDQEKHLVLDGQQRLQSLFIGLKGMYDGKEMFLNILSGDLVAPEDTKFDFRFSEPDKVEFPYLKFKDLVFTDKKIRELTQVVVGYSNVALSEEQKDRIHDNLESIKHVFATQESLLYQLVDSIDRPETFKQDDVVEIFIRANSGGTFLSKSDLLFSLLSANWEEADDNMIQLLDLLNATGYKFNRDFILKTCLVLSNAGAKYQVGKFRNPEVRDKIINDWKNISEAILDVKDFVYGSTFMHTDKTLPSYLVLIPIIYIRYHFKFDWENYKADYQEYLLRSSLSGVFGGNPDSLLNKMINHIKKEKTFLINDIFDIVRQDNRALEITQNNLLGLHYSSKEIHLLFNLWYGFNYQPSYSGNKPQLDHIFPQSHLKKIKLKNPVSGKMNLMKYRWQERDQIANMMLLTAIENGAGGKSDILPKEWFSDKDEEYLEKHLIPKDSNLWEIENYDRFIEARKELIIAKFSYLLTRSKSKDEEE